MHDIISIDAAIQFPFPAFRAESSSLPCESIPSKHDVYTYDRVGALLIV